MLFTPPLRGWRTRLSALRSVPCHAFLKSISTPSAIRDSVRDYLTDLREQRKGAMIFNPLGQLIACGDGDEENLLFADIDLNDVLIPKMVQDAAGHYNRPELFAELFRRD
ncbi:hypothetical protein [Enterobacter cloacae complex sp. 285F6]|uniref:hypothetical protein n=1 Tax=Enterobacter cloacae complex sp. 285F6 TaxID=3395831 RepID=UPI003CFA89A2